MSTFDPYYLPEYLTNVQALLGQHGLSFTAQSLEYDHYYILDELRDLKERETGFEHTDQELIPLVPDFKATLNPVAPMDATFLCRRFIEYMLRSSFQQWVRRLHDKPREYKWMISTPPDSSIPIMPHSVAPTLKSALAYLYDEIREQFPNFPSVKLNLEAQSFSFSGPGNVKASIAPFQYTEVAPNRRIDAQRRCEHGSISETARIGAGLRRIKGVKPPLDQEAFFKLYGHWGPKDEPTLMLPHLSTKSVSSALVRILSQYVDGRLPQTLGYECAARLIGFTSWHALVSATKRHVNNPLLPQVLEIRDMREFSTFKNAEFSDAAYIPARLQIYRQFSDGLVDLGDVAHRVGSKVWNWTYTGIQVDLGDGRDATLAPCGLEPNTYTDIEYPRSVVIDLADKIDALDADPESFYRLQRALMSPEWDKALHNWAEQREGEEEALERALYEGDDEE